MPGAREHPRGGMEHPRGSMTCGGGDGGGAAGPAGGSPTGSPPPPVARRRGGLYAWQSPFRAPTDPTPMTDESRPQPTGSERRRNHALRELIDEMLASIRTAAKRDLWTPEERTQYEQELAGIMTRVRSEATGREGEGRDGAPPPPPRAA